jgi:3-methyladenine DNA glycosylase/8-oxoguanine DNA glycosylase
LHRYAEVAACVCVFSLDKHAAIPVDTHVWQLALEHYTPGLEGKSLTPRIMDEVESAIVGVFGEYAGWAHNTAGLYESNSVDP